MDRGAIRGTAKKDPGFRWRSVRATISEIIEGEVDGTAQGEDSAGGRRRDATHPLRRGEDAAPQSLIHNAANEIGLYSKKSSCPALRRASTSWLHLSKKDVDGRDI